MKIKEVINYLEELAPIAFQEDYDNSGLIVGDSNETVTSVLVTLDVTEEVVDEAIAKGANLIIAHHPIVFRGLKKLNGKNYVERTVIKAIKNDVAIYAIHTNLDNVGNGVNYKIAEKLNLKNLKILSPKANTLLKLDVFVPTSYVGDLLAALHQAGAGNIGNYSDCSFKSGGVGSFRPGSDANPHSGRRGTLEEVEELKVEVILPVHLKNKVLAAMRSAHPYEEVAYYLYPIENENQNVGSGVVGFLKEEMNQDNFLKQLKTSMNLNVIRFTSIDKPIKKVAVCGGSGSFLLSKAKAAGADAFVTADFKYHEFFDYENDILIADIGHFESEIYTKELLKDLLSKRFTKFATYFSEVNTNPVNYYY